MEATKNFENLSIQISRKREWKTSKISIGETNLKLEIQASNSKSRTAVRGE